MGTAFRTYEAARDEAQKRANETGETYGLEIFTLMGTEYVIRQLPKLRNRYGCDLRCETIEPMFVDEQGAGLKVGDLVKVRGPWQMGDRLGDGGKIGHDSITGRVFRVVALRANRLGPYSAALADSMLIGVDESDEIADCVIRRLTKVTA